MSRAKNGRAKADRDCGHANRLRRIFDANFSFAATFMASSRVFAASHGHIYFNLCRGPAKQTIFSLNGARDMKTKTRSGRRSKRRCEDAIKSNFERVCKHRAFLFATRSMRVASVARLRQSSNFDDFRSPLIRDQSTSSDVFVGEGDTTTMMTTRVESKAAYDVRNPVNSRRALENTFSVLSTNMRPTFIASKKTSSVAIVTRHFLRSAKTSTHLNESCAHLFIAISTRATHKASAI